MDIPYTLYYMSMDDLRKRLIERYPETDYPSKYLYANLTHVCDLDDYSIKYYSKESVAEVEIAFRIPLICYRPIEKITRVLLNSNATFYMDSGQPGLEDVITEWLYDVELKYILNNS